MSKWNNRRKYDLDDINNKPKGLFKFNFTKFIKREISYTFLSIIGFSLITMGSSYAIFSSFNESSNYNTLNIGSLVIEFNDTEEGLGNVINLNNALPMTDVEGLKTTPYTFKIKNTGSLAVGYTIRLANDQGIIDVDGCSNNLLPYEKLKYSIDNEAAALLSSKALNNYIIKEDRLGSLANKTHTIKLWIDDKSGNEVLNKHFHGKIVIEGLRSGELLSKAVVNNLGDTGTTYLAEDGSTYIRGESNKVNNYVWYSGMMWRIYRINPDGSVKVIMDDNASALPYGANNTYETSYMKEWLNTYFWDRLNSSKTSALKQNNEFCIDSTDLDTSAREECTNKILGQKIGLMTLNEYNIVKNGSNSNYLNNGLYYLTMTPRVSNLTNGWHIDSDGDANRYNVSDNYGSRSVVLFANVITIASGNGSEGEPYKIMGDVATATSGAKLNTRYSGELINYEGKLFRIMEVTNGLTKAVYDGAVKITPTGIFGTNNLDWNTMKARLEASRIYTSKIAINQTWQRGYMAIGDNALRASLENGNAVTSTFGLPKVGEMWASQNNTKTTNYDKYTNQDYWLMTPDKLNTSFVWFIVSGGYSISRDVSIAPGSRPVILFANAITIASGSGTPESPYTLN